MPLKMFQLRPGEELRYRVAVLTGRDRPELTLSARRPDEGLSLELELELREDERSLGCGRVPLADGYLAVIREVERQLAERIEGGVPGEVWFELRARAAAGPLESSA